MFCLSFHFLIHLCSPSSLESSWLLCPFTQLRALGMDLLSSSAIHLVYSSVCFTFPLIFYQSDEEVKFRPVWISAACCLFWWLKSVNKKVKRDYTLNNLGNQSMKNRFLPHWLSLRRDKQAGAGHANPSNVPKIQYVYFFPYWYYRVQSWKVKAKTFKNKTQNSSWK